MKTRILGGWVIGFDGKQHVLLQNSEIVFEEDKIIFVGQSFKGEADRTIDASDKLVLPGLINVHTHSLSAILAYRGICEDEGSTLYKYLLPIRYGTTARPAYATGSDAYMLSRVTLLELLKSGVTTILEQTDNLEDVLRVGKELGLRLYGCHSYYNGMPFEENGKVVYPRFKDICPGFDENLRLMKEYHNDCNGRIKVWLGPHAPDTCSAELLRETRQKASQLGVGIGTHVAQSLTEVNEIKRKVNKTPVEYLNDLSFWREDVVAAHAIHTTRSDIEIMAQSKMTVAHCASSYVGNGWRTPMASYKRNGINVVFGTDQNAMDLIEEMRLAMFSSKLNEADPFAITCLDVFNGVTLNAAKALGRDDIGRIAPGAKADMTFIKMRQPHLTPFRDPLKVLLYHSNRSDVDTVIVDGRVLMEERNVLTIDEQEVISKAKEVTERIWKKAEAEINLPRILLT